jgi:hypothetical protein
MIKHSPVNKQHYSSVFNTFPGTSFLEQQSVNPSHFVTNLDAFVCYIIYMFQVLCILWYNASFQNNLCNQVNHYS